MINNAASVGIFILNTKRVKMIASVKQAIKHGIGTGCQIGMIDGSCPIFLPITHHYTLFDIFLITGDLR
jgi:hypothetical protein